MALSDYNNDIMLYASLALSVTINGIALQILHFFLVNILQWHLIIIKSIIYRP